MAEDEAPLSPEQLKVVVRKAEQYVALWMAAGLAVFVWRLASGWFDGIYVFDVVPGYVAGWAAMVATVRAAPPLYMSARRLASSRLASAPTATAAVIVLAGGSVGAAKQRRRFFSPGRRSA